MQMKTLLSSLPLNWAVVVMDFSENFHCHYQNEIQSVYWSYTQITVHPCVLHHACPACGDRVSEQLIFFSDDLKHDPHFVRTVQDVTLQHLQDTLQLEKVVFFSDGSPTQHKSKVPFYFLANDAPGVAVERCFFGSRHGKSECDAAGGVIKRLLEDDIITGSVIQSASEAYKHSMENFVLPEQNANESCSHRKRSFRLVKPADVDRSLQSSSVKTVRGTHTLHSLKSAGQNRLVVRRLSCFCTLCLTGNFADCPNVLP